MARGDMGGHGPRGRFKGEGAGSIGDQERPTRSGRGYSERDERGPTGTTGTTGWKKLVDGHRLWWKRGECQDGKPGFLAVEEPRRAARDHT